MYRISEALSLSSWFFVLVWFFVSLTQVGSSGKKKPQLRKTTPSDLPVGKFVGAFFFFLLTINVGGLIPLWVVLPLSR